MRRTILGAAVCAALLASVPAQAANRCGLMKNARWNAPAGAAVVTRTEGVVASTFDGVGRYWTHIVVSDGNDGIYESHRGTPVTSPDLEALTDLPLVASRLRAGGPGPSHTNLPGAMASMRGVTTANDRTSGRRLYNNALFYVGDDRVDSVLAFLDGMGRRQVFEADGRYSGLDRLITTFVNAAGTTTTNVLPYNFLNFRTTLGSESGIADHRGFACSNFLAFAANRATGVTIPPETFSVEAAMRGLKNAHDAAEAECNEEIASWPAWKRDLARATNACGRTGEQVANCLSGVNAYACNNRGSEWKNPANWFGGASAPVRVLSPDRVINWGAATTSNPSPWAQRTGAFGREVTWSVDDTGEDTFGCWGAPGDEGDDRGLARGPDSSQTPQTAAATCSDVTVFVPDTMVRLYHRASAGGDAEMDGNHPRISGTVSLRQQGDTIIADNVVTMTEGGGDRSTFSNAAFPSAYTRPVYVAPPSCTIAGFSTPGGVTGTLTVADAGDDNHRETLYTSANGTAGALSQARCVSDTDGNDSDRLYCKLRLQPITVQLRPRLITIPIDPPPLFPPPTPWPLPTVFPPITP